MFIHYCWWRQQCAICSQWEEIVSWLSSQAVFGAWELNRLSPPTSSPGVLVEKIYKWEFVDMAEMLPEFWVTVQDLRAETSQGNPWPMAKKKVTDIMSWVQCFCHLYQCVGIKELQSCPRDAGLPCDFVY